MWRVDMQRAAHEMPRFKGIAQKKLAELENILFEHLSRAVPANTDFEAGLRECHQIVSDAGVLARNMRLTTSQYGFDFDANPTDAGDKRALYHSDIKNYKIIDCATGEQLLNSHTVEQDDAGKVGERVCTVHPALIRWGVAGGGDLVLVSATILVNFDRQVRRAPKVKGSKGGTAGSGHHDFDLPEGGVLI